VTGEDGGVREGARECPRCGDIECPDASFCTTCGSALGPRDTDGTGGDDEVVLTIDTGALAVGAIAGLLFVAPNVAPTILPAPLAIQVSSNQAIFRGVSLVSLAAAIAASILIGGLRPIPKHTVISAVAAFVVVAGAGSGAVLASAALGDGGAGAQHLSGDDLRVATLSVEGMVCQGCKLTVQNYLESMRGVERVTVSLPKKQVVAIYDSTELTAKEIAESEVFRGAYTAEVKNDERYREETYSD